MERMLKWRWPIDTSIKAAKCHRVYVNQNPVGCGGAECASIVRMALGPEGALLIALDQSKRGQS